MNMLKSSKNLPNKQYNQINIMYSCTQIKEDRCDSSQYIQRLPDKQKNNKSTANALFKHFQENFHNIKLCETTATQLQPFSNGGINSPLWAISQNIRIKKKFDERDLLISRMKQLYDELVASGKLTVENGKISGSYRGEKYLFDLPAEWSQNESAFEAREFVNPRQANKEREAFWNQIIAEAIDRSPGAMVDKLPEERRAKVLREEWLVDDPLTGICTGLALEFLLESEMNGIPESIMPSKESRYWEKLLIPVIEKVMLYYYSDHPDQLNQKRHYRAVYEEMIQIIETKSHLKAFIHSLHAPLSQLGKKLESKQGHSLVIIESPGMPIAANHTIYFNAANRTIADNSVIIRVPQEDNYGAFVDFYIKRMEYHKGADSFTLIYVSQDPQFSNVRKSSMIDRISLSAEIAFNYLMKEMRVPNSSLKDYEIR
ncbi:MAG: hypothetical protein JJU12_07280 [Chlamydiales bacterium]|nr:hypothetical protein [Chlamydiales bacterium]